MTNKRLIILVILSLLPVFAIADAEWSRVAKTRYKAGELLVKYRDEAAIIRSHASKKAGVIKGFKRLNIHHVKLPSSLSVEDAIKEYKKDPNVIYAEPNYIVRKSLSPNDQRYSDQWGHTKISSPAAWNITTGSSNVIVAVLDTGIDYGHPDLVANMWVNPGEIAGNGTDDDGDGIIDDVYGVNYNNGATTGDPMDDDIADSHGTHVAGTIGAVGNNGIGVSGVNWGVKLMAIKFLHGSAGEGYISDAISGISYAVDNGAKIINCSLEVDGDQSSLEDAIKYADSKGVLIVSAAGNGNSYGNGFSIDNRLVSPASIKTANNITVASTTGSDLRSSFSNYGRTTVDVAAPGSDILSTTNHCQDEDWNNECENGTVRTRGYDYLSGTSMAAPQVSGLAALVWSNHTSISHHQVKGRILNGVDKLSDLSIKTITGGRINAYNSLSNPELPAIFKIEPRTLQPGGSVTITGVNFGTYSSAGNTVKVNGVPLTVNTWQDGMITATTPGSAFSGDAQVNGMGSGFYLSVGYQPLSVSLAAIPPHGYAPLAVTFTATASNSGTVVSYEWDFDGDGAYDDSTTGKIASFTYTNAGSYPARVRVTDSGDQTAIDSIRVDVFTTGGASSSGGGCFIATAAFGSYEAPYVKVLREFRDRYLLKSFEFRVLSFEFEMPNTIGRAFVGFYYKVSPPVADFISKSDGLKFIVRVLMLPFIGMAAFFLKITGIQKLIFLSALLIGQAVIARRLQR